MPSKTENGTVKWFDQARAFGFISPDYGADVYVHVTGIVGGASLNVGDRVEYAMGERFGKARAVDVRVVRAAA